MKKIICAAALLLAASLIFAQNPGTDAADRIAERVEAQETKSSDQDALVKEVAAAARAAGKDHPKDPEEVKKAVRKKLDEIRDRKSSPGKPGGNGNEELAEWVKKLKRDLMDNEYVSLPALKDTPLLCSVTGTGRTTGDIAHLSLQNPTGYAITVDIGPCFIPSDGQYQPYIVPAIPPVTVPPYATSNIPLNGYCADIFTAPVPSGAAMPPVSQWVALPNGHTLPTEWQPTAANGWQPTTSTSALIPGTDRPLGHTIDVQKHPVEAAAILLDALTRISTAYDHLKNEGTISTPFSGNPEKERESVIQQTFWRYAAELTGRVYKKEDFAKNTKAQFEEKTGSKLSSAPVETQNNVNQGVNDFWNTFEAVGVEAKVLTANDVDYDKIKKADDLPKLIRPAYDRYAAARALGDSHAKAMKEAFSSEDAREEWDARFKRIYEGK